MQILGGCSSVHNSSPGNVQDITRETRKYFEMKKTHTKGPRTYGTRPKRHLGPKAANTRVPMEATPQINRLILNGDKREDEEGEPKHSDNKCSRGKKNCANPRTRGSQDVHWSGILTTWGRAHPSYTLSNKSYSHRPLHLAQAFYKQVTSWGNPHQCFCLVLLGGPFYRWRNRGVGSLHDLISLSLEGLLFELSIICVQRPIPALA